MPSKKLAKLPSRPIATATWASRLPTYIVKAIRAHEYELREYQAEAVIKAVSLLNHSRNTEICLPPGTGKTLIGQMILSVWLHDHVDERVLCVIPNTNLLEQHFEMSNWAYQARLWEPLKIDARWRSRRRLSHDSDLQNARVWFALPGQLAQAVADDDISRLFLNTVSLVVVDEYDSFSKAILGDEPDARLEFKKDMQSLQRALKGKNRMFLFMSATPAKAPKPATARRQEAPSVWSKTYSPELVEIPKDHYRRYVPLARISPIGVEDALIFEEDAHIRSAMSKRLNVVLEDIHGQGRQRVSLAYLIPRIDGIIRSRRIAMPDRRVITVSPESVRACLEFLKLKFYRLSVFEECGGSEIDLEEVDLSSDWTKSLKFKPGTKFDALVSLIKKELDSFHKIVVFSRYVAPVEGIDRMLQEMGIKSSFVHGSQAPAERNSILSRFKTGNIEVLIASRELFGRGFDLPEADVAIFYSPKDNVRTIWQEFLRIRGTVADPKHIFVLFCLWTAEESKMGRLLEAMFQHGAQSSRQSRWEYIWDYSEEAMEADTSNRDFAYFDYSSGEGAYFTQSSGDSDKSEKAQDNSQRKKEESDPERPGEEKRSLGASDAAGKFAAAFANAVKASAAPWGSVAKSWLFETARSVGMFDCYLESSVSFLVNCLLDAITTSKWTNEPNLKSRKRIVLSHVHPDRYSNLNQDGRTLHNRVTASLIVLL